MEDFKFEVHRLKDLVTLNTTINTNSDVLSNYRAIFKLPFIFRILKQVVAEQFLNLLHRHHILDNFQSGFQTMSDHILLAADSDQYTVLVLLDLSSAFTQLTITSC